VLLRHRKKGVEIIQYTKASLELVSERAKLKRISGFLMIDQVEEL
jgi:hypothetical protein